MKRILAIIIALIGIFSVFTTNISAEEISYKYQLNVSGYAGRTYAGERVMLIIRDKSSNEIAYIGQTTVNDAGDYLFEGKMKKYELSNLETVVNYNGDNITDTIREATVFTELFDIKLEISKNDSIVNACAKIKKLWDIDEDIYNISVALAFYDVNGKLLDCTISDTKKIDITAISEEIPTDGITIPENTHYMKVFAFDGINTLKPLTTNKISYVGESIHCFGDSLTYGNGGEVYFDEVADEDYVVDHSEDIYKRWDENTNYVTYPKLLEQMSSRKVINYGVPGAGKNTIARNQGAYTIPVAKDFSLPSNANDSVLMQIEEPNSFSRSMECTIDGIEVYCHCYGYNSETGYTEYRVSRLEDAANGEAVLIKAGTEVIPCSETNMGYSDITVIWMGTNGLPSSESLIADIDAMIENMPNDKYIVLGVLHYPDYECEDALINKYGDKFIPLRSYFCKAIEIDGKTTTQALYDYGIEPTGADLARIAVDKLPKSFCSTTNTDDSVTDLETNQFDDIHFNARGYKQIAKIINDRIIELGY